MMAMIGSKVQHNQAIMNIKRIKVQTAIDYGSCENYNLHCAIVLEYVSYICDA